MAACLLTLPGTRHQFASLDHKGRFRDGQNIDRLDISAYCSCRLWRLACSKRSKHVAAWHQQRGHRAVVRRSAFEPAAGRYDRLGRTGIRQRQPAARDERGYRDQQGEPAPRQQDEEHLPRLLEHDPEKCAAVFRGDHAQSKKQSAMTIQLDRGALWWLQSLCVVIMRGQKVAQM
jgi:hypothetical protein